MPKGHPDKDVLGTGEGDRAVKSEVIVQVETGDTWMMW